MYKFLTGILLTIAVGVANAGFVHPMDFNGSQAQKKEVIEYIEVETYKSVCETLGLCSEYMLRITEEQDLNSFKYLTTRTDREVMDSVIASNFSIGFLSYYFLHIVYDQEIEAKKDSLAW